MSSPETNDSAQPEFWNRRYAKEEIPWDGHGAPDRLKSWLADTPPGRVLIAGCGSAYEVAAFHEAGWSVVAIDFAAAAVDRARRLLGPLGNLVVLGDFFTHPFSNSMFDVVYERRFLCALPPRLWKDYASRLRYLIRPEGKLAGLFLYGHDPDPPPYPLTDAKAANLFGRDFTLAQDELMPASPAASTMEERWQVWART